MNLAHPETAILHESSAIPVPCHFHFGIDGTILIADCLTESLGSGGREDDEQESRRRAEGFQYRWSGIVDFIRAFQSYSDGASPRIASGRQNIK